MISFQANGMAASLNPANFIPPVVDLLSPIVSKIFYVLGLLFSSPQAKVEDLKGRVQPENLFSELEALHMDMKQPPQSRDIYRILCGLVTHIKKMNVSSSEAIQGRPLKLIETLQVQEDLTKLAGTASKMDYEECRRTLTAIPEYQHLINELSQKGQRSVQSHLNVLEQAVAKRQDELVEIGPAVTQINRDINTLWTRTTVPVTQDEISSIQERISALQSTLPQKQLEEINKSFDGLNQLIALRQARST